MAPILLYRISKILFGQLEEMKNDEEILLNREGGK